VEADDGVPWERVAGGGLREAREDGVRVRVRDGVCDGREGKEDWRRLERQSWEAAR